MIVGQGPIVLAVGAGGGCLDIFILLSFLLFLPLWETTRYRLKYCLKGPLNPKQPTNQPTNCISVISGRWMGDNATEPRLQVKRSSPHSGLQKDRYHTLSIVCVCVCVCVRACVCVCARTCVRACKSPS